MNERIADRERSFYDKLYSSNNAREIQGDFKVPGVEDLEGKRILVCACGSGSEPVLAARAGAEVYTFDISPVSVEKTKELARLNGVRITADVMDFHDLNYPSSFFDLAYGSCVLHHVDCKLAGQGLRRCLKPGGIGAFWENSDRNPIIRWFRRAGFGSPGDDEQRKQFLGFKRNGTTDEYPLTDQEIGILSEIFDGNVKILPGGYAFFRLLAIHVWNNRVFNDLMVLLDNATVRLFPSVWRYSFWQWIWLQKPGLGR